MDANVRISDPREHVNEEPRNDLFDLIAGVAGMAGLMTVIFSVWLSSNSSPNRTLIGLTQDQKSPVFATMRKPGFFGTTLAFGCNQLSL